jgi:hypothetical protein
MQTNNQEQNLDASAYKGILPVHMRQGIPPYLQILFAARPSLPFVTPVNKPHKLQLSGFFDGTDFKAIKEKMHQNAKIRQQEQSSIGSIGPNRYTKKGKKLKEKQWAEKMMTHMKMSKQKYKDWLKREVNNNTEKSNNPFKTIIVAKLVI